MALILFAYRHNLRRQRIFRDRTNPLDVYNDAEIIARYRLPRALILHLCELLDEDLKRPTRRTQALPVSIQITMSLRFFATGNFHTVTGDLQGVSKSSASRIVRDVSRVLVRQASQYIYFPNDRDGIVHVKQSFSDICGIPNVVGAIDCTHIRIKAPSVDEHLFVNRKNFHSVNVQCICDANLRYLDVCARYPGSSHDSYIWQNSGASTLFEEGFNGRLLGDSGYPLRPHLLTPVLNPTSRSEERYNIHHRRGRCVIERSFGVLKARFRCIDNSGGGLQFSPDRVCRIFVAVAVLHNICIMNNLPNDVAIDDEQEDDDGELPQADALADGNGRQIRSDLIRQLYDD